MVLLTLLGGILTSITELFQGVTSQQEELKIFSLCSFHLINYVFFFLACSIYTHSKVRHPNDIIMFWTCVHLQCMLYNVMLCYFSDYYLLFLPTSITRPSFL